jgi:hypothetical protein
MTTMVPRYLPRAPEERAEVRRRAAIQAEVSALRDLIERVQREQQIQLERIAQLQHAVDQLTIALKKLERKT